MPDDESAKWDVVKERATNALTYWVAKLDVRSGANNDQHLKDDVDGMKAFTCLLRAISWVESKHTTDTSAKKNRPDIDPMQCGNPRRPTWRSICGRISKGDRILFADGKGIWLGQLDKALKDDVDFPDDARMSYLKHPKDGRKDPKFSPEMSYYWGTLLLIHKINTLNGATFKAGDVKLDELVKRAASKYNAEVYRTYVKRLTEALALSGCA